ncbi:MAG TPA: hypothetical protein VGS19_29505 [Streptosporangiaceae bacterium]|nr:hypothetical protein [Streptosporangiaceae bacterium]
MAREGQSFVRERTSILVDRVVGFAAGHPFVRLRTSIIIVVVISGFGMGRTAGHQGASTMVAMLT